MSSRWDLGWSKRAYEDGTPYFVVSFPGGSATVKKNPRGMWNAHITLRNGDNRHSVSMDDEFAAMTWAQDKIHEMTTQKVESSTSRKRSFTVKPKQSIGASYIPDMTERYPEGMGGVPYTPDQDADWNPPTLGERIEEYIEDAKSGDFYNSVRISKGGEILYKGNKLSRALAWAFKTGYDVEPLDSSYWHDTDILFTLRR